MDLHKKSQVFQRRRARTLRFQLLVLIETYQVEHRGRLGCIFGKRKRVYIPTPPPTALIMAPAFVRDGVLKPRGGRGPNRYLFPVPKNATKASMIVHLVLFNKLHQSKPHSFCLPYVEDLAFLVQVHSMLPPRLSMSSAYMSYLNDPFSRELDGVRVQASVDEELVACHFDRRNAFWSLMLLEALQGGFRVQIDGQIYGFSFLPFGWQFHP